jgi:cation diffusion facilitator family transporter
MGKNEDAQECGNIHRIILLVLFKEEPLTLEELGKKLEERSFALNSGFSFSRKIRDREKRRIKQKVDLPTVCTTLLDGKYLRLTQDEKYVLTEAGKAEVERTVKTIDKRADILEKQFLNPQATARNTLIAYVFLSAMKLTGGFFGGSVGLIADGADTTVDTASAGLVWMGIKFKKEMLGTLTILALMFATAALLWYKSVASIIENVNGTFLPMSAPYIVIIVEGIALLAALGFSLYQRFVGRRSKSLALISRSIDSQNSVYSTAAVIVGAVFSLFGIYWVDAVVGGFIAARITWNGLGLTRQAISSMKGREPDFTKFKLPFEEKIEMKRMETSATGYSSQFMKKNCTPNRKS